MKRFLRYVTLSLIGGALLIAALSIRPLPAHITYGVSFSKFHSDELGLPWKPVFTALLDELNVRAFRLTAHWPMIEPRQGKYDFSVLDEQMDMARERNAKVILAVGRRTPGWPECHTPQWADELERTDKAAYDRALNDYISAVVMRYKGYENLYMWQIENEPFLAVFATVPCASYDSSLLDEEIAMVKRLDPNHDVLVTDSGEISLWYKAALHGDVFGTSIYLYIWQHTVGPMRYPVGPWFFRLKQNMLTLVTWNQKKIAIEVQAEPWLLQPIKDTPIEEQFKQMNLNRFQEIVEFGTRTGFAEQYLWGAEWWYWLREHGHPELWNYAQSIYSKAK